MTNRDFPYSLLLFFMDFCLIDSRVLNCGFTVELEMESIILAIDPPIGM